MKEEITKKEKGTEAAPNYNIDSVKNQCNLINFNQNNRVSIKNNKREVFLSQYEIQHLLLNSINTLSIIHLKDERRIGSIIKNNRKSIANSLIKNHNKL